MTYELIYWPGADDALAELESDPARIGALKAVDRALVRLSEEPFNPRLGTTAFVTEELGGVCATPARFDDWFVFWQRGEEPRTIEVVLISQLRI